eukprot:13877917-Ditylum_brightwellii.AAC.1
MEILEVDNRKPTTFDPEKPKNKARVATTEIKEDNTNDKGAEEIPKSTNPTVQWDGELLNNGVEASYLPRSYMDTLLQESNRKPRITIKSTTRDLQA